MASSWQIPNYTPEQTLQSFVMALHCVNDALASNTMYNQETLKQTKQFLEVTVQRTKQLMQRPRHMADTSECIGPDVQSSQAIPTVTELLQLLRHNRMEAESNAPNISSSNGSLQQLLSFGPGGESLDNYIGHKLSDVQNSIEATYAPYTVAWCYEHEFYSEDYWENQIRCVTNKNDIITHLAFN